jgi:ATP-dependent DNA helicase RecG
MTSLKESETLELKRSTSELKEAIISIVAILNKHGRGELYFGVRRDGEIIGQDVSEKTLRDVSKAISDNIEPKIYPQVIDTSLEYKKCIRVEFCGDEAPYLAYGRAYIRVGDEDRQLSAKELENMILKKNKDKLRWDTAVCGKARIGDIGAGKLRKFLRKSGLEYTSVTNSLEKLGLLKDDKLLNAALILFGKEPMKFFPNARLRCALFGTTDTSFVISMQGFEGDLFYLIEKAEEYILSNIHIGMRLEGLRRVDVPEINKDAFREAIINAFCHRDYHKYDSVNIAVFKDRVEIRSPGLLYGGLTIERIKTENVSERRNELIAEMFHRVHFVERWGRGIRKILSKEPETDFKEVGRQFIAVFKRKGVGRVGEKVGEKVGERLTENQRKILEAILENPQISAKKLSVLVGISSRKIEENISKLKEKGLLKRIGPDKGGHWEVLK